MDQPIPFPNVHPPALAAASIYRLLLADEIAVALTSGASVAATGTRDTDSILDLTANALIETGARVLQFHPPLDAPSFISQFAVQWRVTGKGLQDLLPQPSGERFMMLFHEAHLMTPEALQHLDRMARAWPGMQMAFAGLPSLVDLLQSEDHPVIKRRVTVYTKIALTEEAQHHPPEQEQLTPAPTDPAEQPQLASSTPTFTIPSGNLGRTGYYPITRRQRKNAKRRRTAALAMIIAAAGLAAAVATIPQMQEWAGTARTYASSLLQDALVNAPPPPDREPTTQAAAQPAPPTEPAPPPLWTAPTPNAALPDAAPPQAPHPDTQLTLLGEQAAPPQPSPPNPNPEPSAPPREASEPPPAPATAPQEVAALAPEPPQTATRTITPSTMTRAEPPQDPARPTFAPPPSGRTAVLPSISSELAEAMTKRGRAMLEWGDVSAARLLLTRATSAGSGEAAFLMGTTFDAATLDRIGAIGIPPDPIQAAAWYRVALLLGEERARALLENEPTNIATAKPKEGP